VQIIRDLDSLKTALCELRKDGTTIGLVPTMGALHAGHMQLVHEAAAVADHVVTSIFVNPTQFGPNEDLDAYPRQENADAEMLEQAGVAILWAPTVDQVYPDGFASSIRVSGVSKGLCGGTRPGHFDGVATVVAKLFNQVAPDFAFFGEKDYQQLAVIRTMARDLNFSIDIRGVPIVRAADGLALSSRNAYLSAEHRLAAATLPRAMRDAVAMMEVGGDVAKALAEVQTRLQQAGFSTIDYVSLCDAQSLVSIDCLDRPARLLVAARIGQTRLIDNMAVEPQF
jgi:pantoate--beta-alanine ligase